MSPIPSLSSLCLANSLCEQWSVWRDTAVCLWCQTQNRDTSATSTFPALLHLGSRLLDHSCLQTTLPSEPWLFAEMCIVRPTYLWVINKLTYMHPHVHLSFCGTCYAKVKTGLSRSRSLNVNCQFKAKFP